MNVSFNEISVMAFKQHSLKPGLQSMTSGQISSGLDLTYASSTITTQQPTEGELDLLFEAMYDDYIGGQPSSAQRIISTTQAHQQQGNQATIQPKTIADNVPNAMFDANTFVNPFATPSTSAVESSSSQYVDPSNMHTFYQPYSYEFQWTKDHPLEQVIREPLRPVLTRNQLRSDGDMCMYALTLKKALYGLNQAPRAWYNELSMFLLQNHFFKGTTDPTLFIRRFVDDILVSNYVLEILKIYGMKSCDPVGTLMEIKDKLDQDQNGTPVDAMKYRSMIGALMYLTSSRPDIVHATCLCARYQDSGFELTGFSDADYARCKDTVRGCQPWKQNTCLYPLAVPKFFGCGHS
uniref:Reverse transcriptase Ty1/copia-type domain-containing protein n=1 Tax=Tanacetum cinerariifolium TaxID=118510 RepID=A0A699K7A8_TANCI|nr:hypothetical protein [Tanacetum cinerariifolium]